MGNLVLEMQAAAVGKYNPGKGWSTCAQPVADLDVLSYHSLAVDAVPVLKDRMIGFCEENNFSYIQIPHAVFEAEYEQSHEHDSFRSWLNAYCAKNGLNSHVNVAIIGPCAKDYDSADRKGQLTAPDRIKDYARGMFVFLEGNKPKASRQNLDRMGDAIAALDESQDTIARKNAFFAPMDSGYRGHKAIWKIDLPNTSIFAGFDILAEVKTEHESQQDANRLTRRCLMGLHRRTDAILPEFFNRCSNRSDESQKITNKNYRRLGDRVNMIDDLAKCINDIVNAKSGLNRFLDSEKLADHQPNPAKLDELAMKSIDVFGPYIYREIDNIGLLSPKVRRSRAHMDLVNN